jgi:hypothetical protein
MGVLEESSTFRRLRPFKICNNPAWVAGGTEKMYFPGVPGLGKEESDEVSGTRKAAVEGEDKLLIPRF